VDFWPQHKDFVLRVLAGLGVFLVALIARTVTFGDELEAQQGKNSKAEREIKSMKLLPLGEIEALGTRGDQLSANVKALAARIGWDAGSANMETALIQRALSYLRRNRDADEATLQAEARTALQAIRDDVNGGFGQLRGTLRDELGDEASEFNVRLGSGLGFDAVTNIQAPQIRQFLLQLELVARVVRYAIDARVIAVEDIRIASEEPRPPILGANPALLEEHAVSFRIVCGEKAVNSILNRLQAPAPDVPLRRVRIQRRDKQGDALIFELIAMATAVDARQPYKSKTAEAKG